MKKKCTSLLVMFIAILTIPGYAQSDSLPKKRSNFFSIGMQPTFFRLNFYDPNFFNNPDFKLGLDASFLYGKAFGESWINKVGPELVFNSGKYLIGKDLDKKYINEAFLRIPEILVKKFQINCNDCLLNPVLFVEAGGYVSFSLYQSTYIQDGPTGLSSLDNKTTFGYAKAGLMGGLGLSFLSNNFGRHVLGIRLYSDQWLMGEFKSTEIKPNYTSISLYYNIANIAW